MSLLVFVLLVVIERQPLHYAAAYASALTCFAYGCSPRRSSRRSNRDSRFLMGTTLDSLWLGFSVALQPSVLWYAFLGCLVGTLVGVLPGIGPLAGISILLPITFGLERHQGDRDARRHLLRLAIWRLDHLDPDAHSGRSLLGDDLHRRQRDGAQGPRRRRALHRGGRLVYCRHVRRDRADAGRAAARRPSRCKFGPPEYTALLVLGLSSSPTCRRRRWCARC